MITLPDSSQVWMNQRTEIEYAEDFHTNRIVRLTGEAYFSVKKAGGQPFTVKTETLTAVVTGTQFNISDPREGTISEITVTEGSVNVQVGKEVYPLGKNDHLKVTSHDDQRIVETALREGFTNWRNNLDFRDASLREVLAALASRYDVKIEISGEIPDYAVITTSFDYDTPLEDVLFLLKLSEPYMAYEITGGTVRITINNPQ